MVLAATSAAATICLRAGSSVGRYAVTEVHSVPRIALHFADQPFIRTTVRCADYEHRRISIIRAVDLYFDATRRE